MPFAVAPACLPAIGICDQREHITIASRVCCSSSTRGGRRAVAGRKRASTTERPLPPHAGVGGSPRTSEHQRARDFLPHLWERSRDAVCRRASVSASYRDMRPAGAYHDSVPSVLLQQHARGQTRCSGTQTSQHDGATFAASCGCGREPTNKRASASA